MYNQDLEGRRPDVVAALHVAEVAGVPALLFVTPEHNRSIPAVLKNAIDWGSKPTDKNVWRGKPAAITGTSFGAIGTAVGQQHLRQILGILGMTVMGGEAYISFKPDPVDNDGQFPRRQQARVLQGVHGPVRHARAAPARRRRLAEHALSRVRERVGGRGP